MRKFLAVGLLAVAVAAQLAPPVAVADPDCDGCNIVDAGWFGRSLIGRLVYYERSLGDYVSARVIDIDGYGKRILWENGGNPQWTSAYNFYSEASKNERTGKAVGAVVGIGVARLLYCAANPSDPDC